MARLDRLAPVKEVAQIGACIGRVFHHRLLAAVTGSDDAQLEGDLQQLEKSELVFRRGVPPEATYTFKHALVQDAAYQSLLKSRRQQIHAIIASTLEAQFPEIAEAEPETLAHHYTAAGLAEQAVAYWLKAGQQALKRSANLEAMAHLGKGLELVAALPGHRGSACGRRFIFRPPLGVTIWRPKVLLRRTFCRPSPRRVCFARNWATQDQLFVALCGEASYHMISGNLRAADELGHQCLELAHASGDPSPSPRSASSAVGDQVLHGRLCCRRDTTRTWHGDLRSRSGSSLDVYLYRA